MVSGALELTDRSGASNSVIVELRPANVSSVIVQPNYVQLEPLVLSGD